MIQPTGCEAQLKAREVKQEPNCGNYTYPAKVMREPKKDFKQGKLCFMKSKH